MDGAHEQRLRVGLLGLGGGGHHSEIEQLCNSLPGRFELVLFYVLPWASEGNWKAPHPAIRAYSVRSPVMYGDSPWRQVISMPAAVWRAFWVLQASRPNILLAVGTAQAIPFGLAARLLGIPLLFVESLTRVRRPSRTAQIMQALRLANQRFYQWEHAATKDPKGRFEGSILQ